MVFGGPGFTSGFIVGFGSGFVSRELVQVGTAVAKPLARTLVKAGITAFEMARETLAQVGESFEDIVAEVRAGMAQKVPQAAAAGGDVSLQASGTASEGEEHRSSSPAGSSGSEEQKKKKGTSK